MHFPDMDVPGPSVPASGTPIPGWKPETITPVPSQLRNGLNGFIDAVRGVQETAEGQPLSATQVETLAPFLAERFELPEPVVRDDLSQVRLYTGGPAGFSGSAGVAIGRNIYLREERLLDRILDWGGRRFLSHELGHTMQWRRTGGHDSNADDLARFRHTARNYVAGMAVDDSFGPGAVPRGMYRWARSRMPWSDRHDLPLSREIHDAHHAEAEAERSARAFYDSTGTAGTTP